VGTEVSAAKSVLQERSHAEEHCARFLNMLSALEALLTLGKCRELPVVGFVKGVLVMGIIVSASTSRDVTLMVQDELTRKPLDSSNTSGPETRSSRQTSLTSFFSPTKPRPLEPKPRTHKVYVSDSKTRASGTLPRESDTLAGRLQCMVYKELLDAMLLAGPLASASASALDPSTGADSSPWTSETVLPSLSGFSFAQVFALLDLDPSAPFSESFLAQSRPVILGNDLRWDVAEARCLNDMTRVWERYVEAIGLGCPGSTFVRASTTQSGKQGRSREADTNAGRTENRLELVYRRAGAKERSAGAGTRSGRGKKRRKGEAATYDPKQAIDGASGATTCDTKQAVDGASEATLLEEQRLLQLAIDESMVSLTSNDGAVASSEAPVDSNHPVSEQYNTNRQPAARQSDYLPERTSDDEREEDELAWAVEMSLAGIQSGSMDNAAVVLPLSRRSTMQSPPHSETDASHSGQNAVDIGCVSSPDSSPPPSPDKNTASGSIIGRHRFQHDPQLVTAHLDSVLQFWMGQREPIGVTVDETQRCGWCEFEDGCEWR
jgi:exonuclease V